MRIALEPPDQPDVIALIEQLDAYQAALYPAESNHFIDMTSLSQPNVLFALARDDAGAALACGGLVLGESYGELKRMVVRPQSRGAGVGRALLAFLESEAQRRGCHVFMLETGIHQPEALALYERAGYRRRGPFGGYTLDPLSVYMEKAGAPQSP